MPAREMTFHLLEQAAAIADPVCRRGKFTNQSLDGGKALSMAARGRKLGVHHPLGIHDNARLVHRCKPHG